MSGQDEEAGVMSTDDRLLYMANQIARNFAAEGAERAAAMTGDHLRIFWAPSMRQRITLLAAERPDALSPVAAAAVAGIAAP